MYSNESVSQDLDQLPAIVRARLCSNVCLYLLCVCVPVFTSTKMQSNYSLPACSCCVFVVHMCACWLGVAISAQVAMCSRFVWCAYMCIHA